MRPYMSGGDSLQWPRLFAEVFSSDFEPKELRDSESMVALSSVYVPPHHECARSCQSERPRQSVPLEPSLCKAQFITMLRSSLQCNMGAIVRYQVYNSARCMPRHLLGAEDMLGLESTHSTK